MLPRLLLDEHFAADLKTLASASAVWGDLVEGLDKDRGLEQSLCRWYLEGLDRPAFPAWWKDNERRARDSLARRTR